MGFCLLILPCIPRDKSQLVMVYDPLMHCLTQLVNLLLNMFAAIFFRDWLLIIVALSFPGFGIRVMLAL